MISRLFKSLGIGLALFGLLAMYSQGQTRPKTITAPDKAATSTGLAVDDVIKMSRAGLSDGIIVQQIKKNGHAFDLTPDQLIQLKTGSVSDRVISVMMDPSKPDVPAPAAPAVAASTQMTASVPPTSSEVPGFPPKTTVAYKSPNGFVALIECPTPTSRMRGMGMAMVNPVGMPKSVSV